MKRLAFVFVTLMLLCLLVGCDFIGGGDTDFNSDLTVVLPEVKSSGQALINAILND